jgi:hypothetical protein
LGVPLVSLLSVIPVAASGSPTAKDLLSSIGIRILAAADYRVVGLSILALYVLLSVARLLAYGSLPNVTQSLYCVLGLGSLFSALAIACVFLLTKPPAFDQLLVISWFPLG